MITGVCSTINHIAKSSVTSFPVSLSTSILSDTLETLHLWENETGKKFNLMIVLVDKANLLPKAF